MQALLRLLPFVLACLLLMHAPATLAQAETAHHRAVYAAIQAGQAQMRQVKASYRDDPVEFSLTGWFEGEALKKIVARSNGDGDGMTEYYLEDGLPLFIFNTYRLGSAERPGPKVEERLYFREGSIFRWLTTETPAPVFHAEDYEATTEQYVTLTAAFVNALTDARDAKDAKPMRGQNEAAQRSIPTRQEEGVFLGLEEGDYQHWQLRTSSGEEVSYFILRPEASVETVLENASSYLGRRCKVTLQKSVEDIPEAGGKLEIEHILSVKWLPK